MSLPLSLYRASSPFVFMRIDKLFEQYEASSSVQGMFSYRLGVLRYISRVMCGTISVQGVRFVTKVSLHNR